jgi:hypothetical protein
LGGDLSLGDAKRVGYDESEVPLPYLAGSSNRRDCAADVAWDGGTFLVQTYRCLADLGVPHTKILTQVFGNDIDPFAAHLASVNLASPSRTNPT